jgi:cyclomaltodextrinase / maltogenic alpha-amylase / neopullulanase
MKRYCWFIILITCACFSIVGCSDAPTKGRASDPLTPLQLSPDTTELNLYDFVANPELINSVICPDGYSCIFNRADANLVVVPDQSAELLGLMRLCMSTDTIDILLKKSLKKKVELAFKSNKNYTSVFAAGEMNAWNDLASPLERDGDTWKTSFWLMPGKYPYLMVLNGQRSIDENNPLRESNGMGGFNSILEVDGPSEEELPFIYTHQHAGPKILIKAEKGPSKVYAFWQDKCILVKENVDSELEIQIPEEANVYERSWIRVYGHNSSGYTNDILIPLKQNRVLSEGRDFTRADYHTQVMYFLMVDRFFDGNNQNNRPTQNSSINPKANFHGGDIAGVLQKVKSGYFDSLGINTIWLSPIPKNPEGAFGLWDKGDVRSTFSAYHGYWPTGLSAIDDRFGTPEDLKALIAEAHSRDINIILDFVAHHIHEEHPLFEQKKKDNWFTDLYLPDGTLNTERWDDHRLTTWFDVFLPTFNFSNQEVCDMLSDSAMFWLDAYGIDGFRHDATKHIDLRFWRTLTKKVNEYRRRSGKAVYQVGETYGSPELIASYVQSGLLDAQFDFNVYDAAIGALCQEGSGFENLTFRLKQSQQFYGSHHLMGNMSGNQDKNRFMAMATGEVRFDEDGKLAGWTRDISQKTEAGFRKLSLMHAINLTIPGVPCIYYGDDIGFTGGNDPDNRRMMKFDGLEKQEKELLEQVSMLSKLRRQLPALSYGSFRIIESKDPNVMVFERRYFDQLVHVVINKSPEAKTIAEPGYKTKPSAMYSNHCCPVEGKAEGLSWTISAYQLKGE